MTAGLTEIASRDLGVSPEASATTGTADPFKTGTHTVYVAFLRDKFHGSDGLIHESLEDQIAAYADLASEWAEASLPIASILEVE